MQIPLEIIPTDLWDDYRSQIDAIGLREKFASLEDSPLSAKNSSFYTSVSAVFSSKIEGEDIELDSFLKHKKLGIQFLPDYTRKIDDLYEAYQFAQKSKMTRVNIELAQAQLTKHILSKPRQGKLRTTNMFVMTPDGKIEYVAVSPGNLETELGKFYHDLKHLIGVEMDAKEAFFFASLLHLVFVKIHPFDDGNGRTARLLEKWFLAEKLGDKAWFVQSEKNYYTQHQTYYHNLRQLGLEYESLDYRQALPFLKMLPQALA